MQPQITIEGWEQIQIAWAKAPEIVREELTAAMLGAEQYLKREVQEGTPVGAHGFLRQSIEAAEPQVLANSVLGEVGSPLRYVESVELGTRPHWAPLQPLIDWVEHKLGIGADKAEGVARSVQLGIAHHGTPGVGMFHRAYNRGSQTVYRIFEAAQGRIVARMGGAA